MKKITCLAAALSLTLLFVSCGSKPEPETVQPEAPVVETTAEEEAEEPEVTEEEIVEVPAVQVSREEALEMVAEADALRKKIDENGFAFYDQKAYDFASDLMSEIATLLEDENASAEELAEKAKTAKGKYKLVLTVAYKKLSQEERLAAYENKRKCDTIKAGIAEKDRYTEATDLFKAGDAAYAIQNPESAYNKYKASKEIYGDIYDRVSVKREAAAKALEEARRKVEESAAFAQEADSTNPLKGEDVQGIEEEDAILLEEDDYTDEVAVEEVPEVLDAPDFEEVTETLVYVEDDSEDEEVLAESDEDSEDEEDSYDSADEESDDEDAEDADSEEDDDAETEEEAE